MPRVRLTRRHRARIGYIASCAVVVAGLYLAAGIAAAVIVAGLLGILSFLLLYDVDGESGEPAADRDQPSRRFDPTL